MTSFDLAIIVALSEEGGFRNVETDHGGPTKWGISQTFLRDVVGVEMSTEQIEQMPRSEAVSYYRKYWWNQFGYASIDDQDVATKLFTMAINMGHSQAVRLLQEALTYLGKTLEVDGRLGPTTFAAVNSSSPHLVLIMLCGRQAAFYVSLVRQDPSQLHEAKGWLIRALWPFVKES